jgi:asparagine synthase (glutamine-hydrolysing)
MGENLKELFAKKYKLADSDGGSLSKLLYLDTRMMLPDNLLLFNDKITMANSIENRVPYLDIDLVNFVETLPINFKLNGKITKYLHRKAAEDWLPKNIINRKKRAFETPVGDWFKKELSDTLIQLIDSSNSFSRIYFNINFIKEIISDNIKNKRDYEKLLFIILSLELWYINFYQKNEYTSNKSQVFTF